MGLFLTASFSIAEDCGPTRDWYLALLLIMKRLLVILLAVLFVWLPIIN